MKPISRKWIIALLALVLLVGFGVRVALIFQFDYGPNLFADDNGYLTGAITFVNTGYISYGDATAQTTATCVGMPFLLGAILRIFGYTRMGLIASHIAFACLGLVSAFVVYLIGERLHSGLAGLFGAAICALDPCMIATNCVFLTESPFICFNLLAIYFYLRCSQKWSVSCFWAGVLCMISAALFKGLALLSCLVVVPVLWRRRVPVRRWLSRVAVAVLAFVLCFAPWWVRNDLLLDRFVMFTANRGDIQLMGSYIGFGYPEGDYDEMAAELDAEAWIEGYQADGERRFERRGEVGKERLAEWFKTKPLAFLFSHALYKPFVMVTSVGQAIRIVPEPVYSAFWYMVLLLAVWGILTARRSSKPDVYAPAFYLMIALVVTAVYAPLSRYGVPYMPFWCLYAGIGLADLWKRIFKTA